MVLCNYEIGIVIFIKKTLCCLCSLCGTLCNFIKQFITQRTTETTQSYTEINFKSASLV